ncbi:MAG: YfhO family protein [Limisphaerales bacterium]
MESTNNLEPGLSGHPSGGLNRGDATGDWFSAGRFALILALFIVGTFPLVVVGRESFVFRDYGVLAYPFAFYQHQCFWRGELPLWNPLSNCGAPFLAQWGTMALYPPSLIYLLLPMPWSLGIFCLGHVWLAGFGMYFLARYWTGNRFAASAAGLVFVFNGITLSCLIWPNYTVALGWMPWVVLLAERAWREGGRTLVWVIVAAALQLLSGVPEIVLFTWLLVLAVWFGQFIVPETPRRRMIVRLGVVILVATGLTAAQTLPFFDLLAHSQRDTAFATIKWTLPGWGWANFLVPMFHCYESYQGIFFQDGQEFFSSCYLGLGPLMLAVLAVGRVRQKRVWFLAGVVLLSMTLALGDNGFVYAWLRRLLPVVGFARYPVKFLLLATFAVPLLAAYALARYQTIPSSQWKWERRSVAIAGGTLAGLMLGLLWFAHRYPFPLDQWAATWKNALGRAVFAALMGVGVVASVKGSRPGWKAAAQLATLLVLLLDVLTHTPSQNPTVPAALFVPGMVELKPPPRVGEGRVMISPIAEQHLLRSKVRDLAKDFMGKRLALWSNLNALDEVPKVNGSSTLQLREQFQVQSLLYATPTTDLPRLADFLSVSYITAPGTIVEWTNRITCLPWITAGQRPVFADATTTLPGLAGTNFDARQIVYLPPEAKSFIMATQAATVRVLSQRMTGQRVDAEVDAQQPGLVVIGQSFYHAWQAYVDKKPVPLWRANHAFQAVEVPAGSHRVELVYRDRWFFCGALISGASVLGLLIAWFRIRPAARASVDDSP